MKWTKEWKKQIFVWVEKGYEPNLKILENGDKIDTNYSLDCIALTDEHIKAIKEGKALNFDINGGEYAGLIFYKEAKNETK